MTKESALDYSYDDLQLAGNALKKLHESFDFGLFESKIARLFHYTSPEGLIGILAQDRMLLRFSRFDCVNDKTEGCLVYDLFNEVLNELRNDRLVTDQLDKVVLKVEQLSKGIFSCCTSKDNDLIENSVKNNFKWHFLEYNTYLCCFSEDQDSLPMWNYYTKGVNSRGYSIGFSKGLLSRTKGISDLFEMNIKKIVYSRTEQIDLIRKLILGVQNNLADLDEFFAVNLINSLLSEWRFLFKQECFSHEKEVRAILKIPIELPQDADGARKFELYFRSNYGYVVPYVELEFPKNSVKSICMGPQLDYASARIGVNALLVNRSYNGVKIIGSEIPTRF